MAAIRQPFATEVDPDLLEGVRALAKAARRPLGALVDEAFADLLSKHQQPRAHLVSVYGGVTRVSLRCPKGCDVNDHLTVTEVPGIHYDQIGQCGGAHGTRGQGQLESAVFRPQTGYEVPSSGS